MIEARTKATVKLLIEVKKLPILGWFHTAMRLQHTKFPDQPTVPRLGRNQPTLQGGVTMRPRSEQRTWA
jgi:hypothetical protein